MASTNLSGSIFTDEVDLYVRRGGSISPPYSLLTDTTPTEQRDLMDIFEYRGRGKSTILCSQCAPDEWHTKLGSGYVADAILDRITNNSYSIILEGDSQRKLKAVKE